LGWRRQLEAERSQLGMWLRLWQQLSSKHHTGSSGLGDGRNLQSCNLAAAS
jgi:hypothetical protein